LIFTGIKQLKPYKKFTFNTIKLNNSTCNIHYQSITCDNYLKPVNHTIYRMRKNFTMINIKYTTL